MKLSHVNTVLISVIILAAIIVMMWPEHLPIAAAIIGLVILWRNMFYMEINETNKWDFLRLVVLTTFLTQLVLTTMQTLTGVTLPGGIMLLVLAGISTPCSMAIVRRRKMIESSSQT